MLRSTVLVALTAVAWLPMNLTARAGQTLFASSDSQSIIQITPSGSASTFLSTPGTIPNALAFDSSGNLYFTAIDHITKVAPDGSSSLFATFPNFSRPRGLAFNSSGILFAACFNTGIIYQVPATGIPTPFVSLASSANPVGLAFDPNGNLYAAGNSNNQISKITPAGNISLFATLPTAPASEPEDLVFDPAGNLYVANANTNTISKISPAGTVGLFATLPAFSFPIGLAIDQSGNLYAADVGINQISQISPDGLHVNLFATLSSPEHLAFIPEPTSLSLLVVGITTLLRHRRKPPYRIN